MENSPKKKNNNDSIDALGTLPKGLVKKVDNLGIRWAETIQKQP